MLEQTMNCWIKRVVVFLFVASGCVALLGCNTVKGAGEDIEDAGEAVQDAAD